MDPDSEAVRAAMGAMKVALHRWFITNRNRSACLQYYLSLQEEKKKDENKDGDKK